MLKAIRLNSQTYPIEAGERALFDGVGCAFDAVEGHQPEEIIAAAEDCDALLVVSSRLPAFVIEKLSRCRVIARLGAGTDRIDVAAATKAGIVVANVPDFCMHEQAEHTLALLLACARRLPYMADAMKRGDWSARHHPGVHRIAGRTLGLVGFGSSAQGVARRAGALDLHLLAWARNPAKYRSEAESLNVTMVELDRLLGESDFVSVHLPLTPETHHLLDANRLARMRATAILINTARGAVIDEQALVAALRTGRIAGAALDVFEGIDVFAPSSGAPEHPLLALNNVLLTPHCAGSSVESTADSKLRGAGNAVAALQGRWPRHVVNPEVQPRVGLLPMA